MEQASSNPSALMVPTIRSCSKPSRDMVLEDHSWPCSEEWVGVFIRRLPMWVPIWWERSKRIYLRIHPRTLRPLLITWETMWVMWLVCQPISSAHLQSLHAPPWSFLPIPSSLSRLSPDPSAIRPSPSSSTPSSSSQSASSSAYWWAPSQPTSWKWRLPTKSSQPSRCSWSVLLSSCWVSPTWSPSSPSPRSHTWADRSTRPSKDGCPISAPSWDLSLVWSLQPSQNTSPPIPTAPSGSLPPPARPALPPMSLSDWPSDIWVPSFLPSSSQWPHSWPMISSDTTEWPFPLSVCFPTFLFRSQLMDMDPSVTMQAVLQRWRRWENRWEGGLTPWTQRVTLLQPSEKDLPSVRLLSSHSHSSVVSFTTLSWTPTLRPIISPSPSLKFSLDCSWGPCFLMSSLPSRSGQSVRLPSVWWKKSADRSIVTLEF